MGGAKEKCEYWNTEVFTSLKWSALPHDAERLCPPPLLLPRGSSAQELGVFKRKTNITGRWMKSPVFEPLGALVENCLFFLCVFLLLVNLAELLEACHIFCHTQSTQQLESARQKWSPTAVLHTCPTTAVQRKLCKTALLQQAQENNQTTSL